MALIQDLMDPGFFIFRTINIVLLSIPAATHDASPAGIQQYTRRVDEENQKEDLRTRSKRARQREEMQEGAWAAQRFEAMCSPMRRGLEPTAKRREALANHEPGRTELPGRDRPGGAAAPPCRRASKALCAPDGNGAWPCGGIVAPGYGQMSGKHKR
jgi:hypothetical protein